MEVREKLTQHLGFQTVHKIATSDSSSSLEGYLDDCSCSVCVTVFTCLSCKDMLLSGGLDHNCPSKQYIKVEMCILEVAVW